MVVFSDKPIRASTSYNLPLEPARPYWMLEYISKSNKRKDYDDNFEKYEKELKVPYYLMFCPDNEELTLYRLREKKFISVEPNRQGCLPVPELDIEVAIVDGWVRFWYKGQLLPSPTELLNELRAARQQADELQSRLAAVEEDNRVLREEVAAIRAALAQSKGRANGSRGSAK
jgi:hypothetical protein